MKRYSGGENKATSISVFSFGAGRTDGTSWSDIDFLDFNGDGYPDVVGSGSVQRTLPNGALDSERDALDLERVRRSTNVSNNVNLGATMSRPITNSRNRLTALPPRQGAYNLERRRQRQLGHQPGRLGSARHQRRRAARSRAQARRRPARA